MDIKIKKKIIIIILSAIWLYLFLNTVNPYGINDNSLKYWFYAVYIPIILSLSKVAKYSLTLLTLISGLLLFATELGQNPNISAIWFSAINLLIISLLVLLFITFAMIIYWKIKNNDYWSELWFIIWIITFFIAIYVLYSLQKSSMDIEFRSGFMLGIFIWSYWTLTLELIKWVKEPNT